jgi:hypothetical protein
MWSTSDGSMVRVMCEIAPDFGGVPAAPDFGGIPGAPGRPLISMSILLSMLTSVVVVVLSLMANEW